MRRCSTSRAQQANGDKPRRPLHGQTMYERAGAAVRPTQMVTTAALPRPRCRFKDYVGDESVAGVEEIGSRRSNIYAILTETNFGVWR